MPPDVCSIAASLALALGVGLAAFVVGRVPAAELPTLGHRGIQRRRALSEGGLFCRVEPVVRKLAGLIRTLPVKAPTDPRRAADRIARAGDFLGLGPDELDALSLLCAAGLAASAFGLCRSLEVGSFAGTGWTLAGAALGGCLPRQRITAVIAEREKGLARALPSAIDLAALCMGAGVDFPGALRLIVSTSPPSDVVRQELSRVLEEIDLGHTRREALESLQRRAPIDSVTEFVQAVVQAEEKGNPLAEVLRIQASVMRSRRSVRAEEAAARAGVMMMLPLVLLLGCILLVLFGPFIVNGFGMD